MRPTLPLGLLVGLVAATASPSGSPSLSTSSTSTPKPCQDYRIRREWGSTPANVRKSFIKSVKCLMDKPSIIPAGLATGALSRYDDFIATHINRTYAVHANAVFITWHREFIRLFEAALQTECGYNDTVPYWDFPKWAGNLSVSPIFDGSDTSLGGDGLYNTSSPVPMPGGTPFPKGHGGGPVVTGPFANLTLHFKNFDQSDTVGFQGVLPNGSLDYSPHPFRRDLNSYIATHLTNQSAQDYLMYKAPNISDFQNYLSDGTAALALHPGAHYTAGPDLWDFFASPSDPSFWLLHSGIDRIYTTWQASNPAVRKNSVSGTSTCFNIPPSAPITVNFLTNWGFLGEAKTIKQLLNNDVDPYCYKYL